MKGLKLLLIITITLAFAVSLGAMPVQSSSPVNKVLSGQLVTVNSMAKLITVRDPDGQEWTFHYTDDTKIVDPDKNEQGLTGKTGARLLVTYHEDQGNNWATVIDITE